MKKNLYFVLLVLIAQTKVFSQQIPNSNFEQWDGNDPIPWTAYITYIIKFYTAEKTTDAKDGQYAVKLETVNFFGYKIPGMIQLGQLNTSTLEPYGGIPFTSKPNAMSIWLKYFPQNGDSLVIYCYLSKYNPITHKRKLFGGTFWTLNRTVSKYTQFLIPIYYIDTLIPDTINIFISSSYKQITPGSKAFIDKIELLYGNYLLPPNADFPENITTKSFIAKWAGPDYAKGYYLDVASDENFNNYLPGYQNLYVGDTTKYLVTVNDSTIKKVYYRVKCDYDSVISDYSSTISFPLPYPPYTLPATEITSLSFRANWEHQEFAKEYIFDLSEDSLFRTFVSGYYYFVTDKNYVDIYGLNSDKDYYYRVRARYEISGKSDYSKIIKVHTYPEFKSEKIIFFVDININSGFFWIDTNLYKNSTLKIYDLNGKLITSQKITERYIKINNLPLMPYITIIQKPDGTIKRMKTAFLKN